MIHLLIPLFAFIAIAFVLIAFDGVRVALKARRRRMERRRSQAAFYRSRRYL